MVFFCRIKFWIYFSLLIISVIVGFFGYVTIYDHYNRPERDDGPLNLKTVIFDFDGTIVNTLPLYLGLANELATKNGFKGFNDLENVRHLSIMEAIQSSGMKMWNFPKFAVKLKSKITENIDKIELFEGIVDVLEELSNTYEVGIITSNDKDVVEYIMKKYDFGKYISFLESTGFANLRNFFFGKSGLLNSFLMSKNLKTNEVVYVGDEIRDIEACKKSFLKIIAVSYGYNSHKLLRSGNPDYIVSSTSGVLEMISKLGKSKESNEL